MPEKDPNSWLALLQLIPESLQGAVMAFIVSMLRLMYDNKEPNWLRRLIEGFICAFLAYSVFALTKAFGMSTDFAFVGSVLIGFLGADFVREKARLWFSNKANKT